MIRLAILASLCPALVLAAGQTPCATCHPREVSAFADSSMGRSLSTVAAQPAGRIQHESSSSIITIRRTGDQMVQRVEAKGLAAEYPVAYVVGAGKVGYSFLISIPPFLFQSPASFYSQARTWDVTPGYEPERVLDFTHPIRGGCVFCHSGNINLVPGTDNEFREAALTPISCERCHGPTEAHLRQPVKGSIVNPAKLPIRSRDSVCEQCHLEGEARILNPGKHWGDFKAGNELESVFATYVQKTDSKKGVKAVSQVEQLALSRCARESAGRLWCGSCHNPHSVGKNRATEIRDTCLSCHATLLAGKHAPADECVSCHMPPIRPNNVSHAAITNHLIAKPGLANVQAREPGNATLYAWREPDAKFAERDLGLALFQTGVSVNDERQILRAYEILSRLPQRDGEVLAALGSILLQQKHADLAVRLYTQALATDPKNARWRYVLGSALAAQGHAEAAIAEMRRSIELDPSSPDPYKKLAQIYDDLGQGALSKQALHEYLKFMPQNLAFRAGH